MQLLEWVCAVSVRSIPCFGGGQSGLGPRQTESPLERSIFLRFGAALGCVPLGLSGRRLAAARNRPQDMATQANSDQGFLEGGLGGVKAFLLFV